MFRLFLEVIDGLILCVPSGVLAASGAIDAKLCYLGQTPITLFFFFIIQNYYHESGLACISAKEEKEKEK